MFSHETDSYLDQQEKELKLLELIRNCIQSVIKSDVDYSNNLNSITIHATKLNLIIDVDDSLGSFWQVISKELHLFSHMIKKRSEIMSIEILQILDSVISERKFLKRHYKEDRARFIEESKKLQNHLNKIKSNYRSCIQLYLVNKMKYEEICHCSSGEKLMYAFSSFDKQSKKFCQIKDAYVKCARKLHLVHNEYIFAIKDSNHYISDLEFYLLPNLNSFVNIFLKQSEQLWKKILQKFLNLIDFRRQALSTVAMKTNDHFKMLIKNDYKRIKDNLSSLSKLNDINQFKFDEKLLKYYTGTLKEDQLAVDKFTYKTLKAIEFELQTKMIKCQQEIQAKEKKIKVQEAEIEALIKLDDDIHLKTLPLTSRQAIGDRRKSIEIIRKSIIELECKYERYHKKWEFIESGLIDVNGDSIPSGLELDAPFKSSFSSPALATVSLNKGKNKWLSEKSISFKRRSETLKHYSAASLRYIFINKFRSSTSLSTNQQSFFNVNESQNQNSNYLIQKLEDEEWFHGPLPRENVARLLYYDGDFLVRESYSKGDKRYVISVKWNGSIKHFLIQESETGYFKLETLLFESISGMICYYLTNEVQLSTKTNAMIVNPISKENWELNDDDIELKEVIGQGTFGDVYRGVWIKRGQSIEYFDVAVKRCKKNLPDEQKKRLLKEAQILKRYKHQNIIKFIGVCIQRQPIMLILEFASEGSLLNYLRNKNNQCYLKIKDLVLICLNIAFGMEYLQNQKCIHRDLAARNCLITKEKVVKISDFGMSREIVEEYTVPQKINMIFVKWTAPEALNFGRYTIASDVWSFGILMWEIFSLGGVPYSGMSNNEIKESIDNGYRLASPPNTPVLFHNLMKNCWSYDPNGRPNFTKIRSTIERLKDKKLHF